jgi:hypothetical protein
VAARHRGRCWWLNGPWYTDWVVWVATAVGVAGAATLQRGAAEPGRALKMGVDVLAAAALAMVCGGMLLAARGAFRSVKRKRERELDLTLTVRVRELGASVKYTRHGEGIVTAAVRGVPLARRLEVLAAARADAERRGFLRPTSSGEDAHRPSQ